MLVVFWRQERKAMSLPEPKLSRLWPGGDVLNIRNNRSSRRRWPPPRSPPPPPPPPRNSPRRSRSRPNRLRPWRFQERHSPLWTVLWSPCVCPRQWRSQSGSINFHISDIKLTERERVCIWFYILYQVLYFTHGSHLQMPQSKYESWKTEQRRVSTHLVLGVHVASGLGGAWRDEVERAHFWHIGSFRAFVALHHCATATSCALALLAFRGWCTHRHPLCHYSEEFLLQQLKSKSIVTEQGPFLP